jgi:hypothetical protein
MCDVDIQDIKDINNEANELKALVKILKEKIELIEGSVNELEGHMEFVLTSEKGIYKS